MCLPITHFFGWVGKVFVRSLFWVAALDGARNYLLSSRSQTLVGACGRGINERGGPINCSLHAGRVGEQVAEDAAGEEEGGGAVLDHVAPLVVPQVAAGKDAKFVVLAVWRCRGALAGNREHSRRFGDESLLGTRDGRVAAGRALA